MLYSHLDPACPDSGSMAYIRTLRGQPITATYGDMNKPKDFPTRALVLLAPYVNAHMAPAGIWRRG